MKIGCNAPAVSSIRNDQWTTARCEARCMINAGFGFGLLGHSVDIIGSSFPSVPIEVSPNVFLRNTPDYSSEYDIFCGYNINPGFTNYKRSIHLLEPCGSEKSLKALPIQFPKADFFVLCRRKKDKVSRIIGKEVRFFPMLFPNPSLPGLESQDFKPFSFDISKKEINLWIYACSWPNYYIECDSRIRFIVDMLLGRGYTLNITLHWNGLDPIRPAMQHFVNIGAKVINSRELSYIDVLNILDKQDICITKGGPVYYGNCVFDILSLGKLLFYVTEGKMEDHINDLYPLEDYVIRQEDSQAAVKTKFDRIMSNPMACYDSLAHEIPFNFPRWSPVVQEILETLK